MLKTYAMLDNSRKGSCIKEKITEELRIAGRKLKQNLKSLTGEKPEELPAVNGLIVCDISCGSESPVEWIEVPKAYLRCLLPIEKVVTPKRIKKWKYFNLTTAQNNKDNYTEVVTSHLVITVILWNNWLCDNDCHTL